MAALSADRSTPTRHPEGGRRLVSYPQATGTTIYKGAIVAVTAATGYARPAADVAGLKVVGVAMEQSVNAGADGARRVLVACGAAFKLATALTQAAVSSTVVVADDQTVTSAAVAVNDIPVGMMEELDGTSAWVYIGPTA